MSIRQEISELKDLKERQFNLFAGNFYIMKAAVRYFGIKKGKSITSTRVSENFPLTIPTAGSCLNILEELNVLEDWNETSSAKRYMPGNIDMERLEEIEHVLVENYEIEPFN